MMQHGIAGAAVQAFLTELARLVGLAGIEGRGRAANNVLGSDFAHGKHIRTKQRACKEGRPRTLAKKAGSDPGLLHLHAVIVRESRRSGFSILSLRPAITGCPRSRA